VKQVVFRLIAVFSMLGPPLTWGAITLVQEKSNYTTGGTTAQVTLPQRTQAGDTLVVAAIWSTGTGAHGTPAFSDDQGYSYAVAVPVAVSQTGFAAQTIDYVPAVPSSTTPPTLSVTVPGPQAVELVVAEYSGIQEPGALDATSVGASASGAFMDSGTVIVSEPGELLVEYGECAANVADGGVGFTVVDEPFGDLFEDEVAQTAGPAAATGWCQGPDWLMELATFRAAAPDAGAVLDGGSSDAGTVSGADAGPSGLSSYTVASACNQAGGHEGFLACGLAAVLFAIRRQRRPA
jgi:hypothetical protein